MDKSDATVTSTIRHQANLLACLASLSAICLLCGFDSDMRDEYFECAGKNDNGMVIFREFPTLRLSDRGLKITNSDVFSRYNYELCEKNDSTVSFATSQEICRADKAAITSLNSLKGTFNKLSGRLELKGAQGLGGEYECKASTKKY